MNNNKIRLGLGLVVVLALTGCSMDMDRSNSSSMDNQPNMATDHSMTTEVKPVQKSYATKDPVQKSVPGPKRAAAPTLPVIQ